MAVTVEELVAKMSATAAAAKVANKAFVKQGAVVITGSVFASMAARGLGSHRLRNVGRGGARLGVRSTFTETGGSPGAIIKATGPWQIVEDNTHAHRIEPSGDDVLALKIGDGFAAYADHPGTKGKHAWTTGVEAARKPVASTYQKEMAKVITTAF